MLLGLLSAVVLLQAQGFAPRGSAPRRTAAAAAANKGGAADAAVAVYRARFGNKKRLAKPLFFATWGVPARDIDGTTYTRVQGAQSVRATIPDATLRKTFAALAALYGQEAALAMVASNPVVLSFEAANFKPALESFAANFGEAPAKAMVQRNPLLLAVAPTGYGSAEAAGPETMAASYLVAATRPLGPVLLAALAACLATPALEAITGLPLRATTVAAQLPG